MADTITTSTEGALNSDLLKSIGEKSFCIVGCGAVGAAFAEMLVRTGAKKLRLIDHDDVEMKNLNRVIGFFEEDVGKKKVNVLAKHLMRINSEIAQIETNTSLFMDQPDETVFGSCEEIKKVRNMVASSDVVIMAMDNNQSRIECEQLCVDTGRTCFLSVGVRVDKDLGFAYYQCVWKPLTPLAKANAKGYGLHNASFASIVLEAAAAGFNLMLHHLQNPDSSNLNAGQWEKGYQNFLPIAAEESHKLLEEQERRSLRDKKGD